MNWHRAYLSIKIAVNLILLPVLIFPAMAYGHPGRTDSSGGHTCRTNCPDWGLSYGEYHYHGYTPDPEPSPTWEFNGRTYYSYNDYQTAKSDYEAEQSQKELLETLKEKEDENNQLKIERDNLLQQSESNSIKDAEQNNSSNSDAVVVLLTSLVLGGSGWFLYNKIRSK